MDILASEALVVASRGESGGRGCLVLDCRVSLVILKPTKSLGIIETRPRAEVAEIPLGLLRTIALSEQVIG